MSKKRKKKYETKSTTLLMFVACKALFQNLGFAHVIALKCCRDYYDVSRCYDDQFNHTQYEKITYTGIWHLNSLEHGTNIILEQFSDTHLTVVRHISEYCFLEVLLMVLVQWKTNRNPIQTEVHCTMLNSGH